MKGILLASASISALVLVTPALAAPPPPVPAIYSWIGFYVGGNIGYSWGSARTSVSDPSFSDFEGCCGFSSAPTYYGSTMHLNGLIGGGQIGHRWQSGNWVGGIEIDFQGSGEKGNAFISTPYNDFEGYTLTQSRHASIAWFDTARLRFGWLLNPTTWVYATGGVAVGKVTLSGTVTDDPNNTGASFSYGGSAVKVGWVLGAGVEAAILDSRNWTWKVEYLYMDLGSIGGTGYNPITGGTYTWSGTFTDQILRVGVNYRFDNVP